MKLPRRTEIVLLIGIFMVSFFLRAYHPLSRPRQWLDRAEGFNQVLDENNWEAVYWSRHPGYTVMVISGLTLRLHDAVEGTPAEWVFDWAIPASATDFGTRMAVGVVGLALVIAALIVAITLALRRLGGWPLALTAAGLLTFAPFYLSQSRVLHVDALLSTLMLLSALLGLLSLKSGQRRYLLASGLVGGFALLTKTPSLFLVPYTGLTLLAHLVTRLGAGWAGHAERRGRWFLGEVWQAMILPMLLWTVMFLLPLLLWPAVWVKPAEALGGMFTGTLEHVLTPHKNRRFFAGDTINREYPGVLFYPIAILMDESFLTLPLILIALGHYTLWRRRVRPPLLPVIFWLLVAYPVFFTIQMGIGAKQAARYVLPAHLPLTILAAVGLLGLIDLIQQALADRRERLAAALPAVLIGLTVGLQALVTLPFAPDYGAHHNYLLGGNLVAVNLVEVMDQNEGNQTVAGYLNSLPDAESLIVSATKYSVEQYFAGEKEGDPSDIDYYIFSMRTLQRRVKARKWEEVWEGLQGYPAELTISYDGVEHVWLYASQPVPSTKTIRIRRGWVGFIGVAWAWTLALFATLAITLRRRSGGEQGQEGGR